MPTAYFKAESIQGQNYPAIQRVTAVFARLNRRDAFEQPSTCNIGRIRFLVNTLRELEWPLRTQLTALRASDADDLVGADHCLDLIGIFRASSLNPAS
ncbi:hypothetical protein AB9E34_03260 [Rhizobium leguminosarum]|uniref:hypothetical protein n=1 Tax=Rhizobium leguminosarum TaxID=384 RepID=UPI003F9E5BB4